MPRGQRGIAGKIVKAILIKIGKVAIDKVVSFALPKLAEEFEKASWDKRGMTEGLLRVTQEGLARTATQDKPALDRATPASTERSLLFLHGTFSDTAAAYKSLASSKFFDLVSDTYGDRIFGFDHFTISRTPEENARMLLEVLPDQTTTFDVITHSRGGLVLRNLVEKAEVFGQLSRRFKLGRAVLVASPNQGTPLATADRWKDTVGWLANLLEMFPESPFTTGPAFVANGLVWIAGHASGDLPGLQSMDGSGAMIAQLQSTQGPPDGAYSALVANYNPTSDKLLRIVDAGVDQFFGSANDLVVPTEGGWRVAKPEHTYIPGDRIGCFGPGGNLDGDLATHINLFSQPPTADFLVRGLFGTDQLLRPIEPLSELPDHRILRAGPANRVAAASFSTPVQMQLVGGRAGFGPSRSARSTPPSQPPLQVTIVNGDLSFEKKPLLIGHYRARRLTGTERVMDDLIGGAMKRSLDLGLYPRTPGSHQIFINMRTNPGRPNRVPRPKAVIVVGLGEEGKLSAVDLVQTVRQAVIAWAQRTTESPRKGTASLELSATLLGSGGSGVTAAQAAQRIVQGVYEANLLLSGEQGDKPEAWPRVGHLRLIELYLDRATEAWRALRMQAADTLERYSVSDEIGTGTGSLSRPLDSGYRGASYDFISVRATREKDGQASIQYALDTKRARSEVRARHTQGLLLRDLVAVASNAGATDLGIGRTLFKLLVPLEMAAYLAGSGEMQIELGPETAGIPWELLDTDDGEHRSDSWRPWAVRTKLLRKLRTAEFRERVIDANADASVLIIGEPECPREYPRLPGARAEAVAVYDRLTSRGGLDRMRVRKLFSDDQSAPGADAGEVVNALFAREWRIIHIAGHGALMTGEGAPGGVVLSNGAFLGPNEIEGMGTVPELVFINCCHLAGRSPDQLPGADTRPGYDRVRFAAGVAEKLIRVGVRCVIAAGWAVADQAAQTFATQFYDALVRGSRFIDAVAEAREQTYAYHTDDNTWAAYQCYGDPDWRFLPEVGNGDSPASSPVDEFVGVASAATLKLALETIVAQTKFQRYPSQAQLPRVQALEDRFAPKWGTNGSVAELFAAAYAETRGTDDAIRWYERAVRAADGNSSMKAAEQLANLRVRKSWETVEKARKARDKANTDLKNVGTGRSAADIRARADAKLSFASAKEELLTAASTARSTIREATVLLETLLAIHPTMERENIYGSAYKRLALIEATLGRHSEQGKAIEEMRHHYRKAANIAVSSKSPDAFYPALNYLAAELALYAGKPKWIGPDKSVVAAARASLDARSLDDPDFWSVAGQTELQLYEAVISRKLAGAIESVEKGYHDLHRRVNAPWMWSSVYDTTRFVLQTYLARATARDAKAAEKLLAFLKTFAEST